MNEKLNFLNEDERTKLDTHRSHNKIRRLGDRAISAIAKGPSIKQLEEKERHERLSSLERAIENVDRAIAISQKAAAKQKNPFLAETEVNTFSKNGPFSMLLYEVAEKTGRNEEELMAHMKSSFITHWPPEDQIDMLHPPQKMRLDDDYYWTACVAFHAPDKTSDSSPETVRALLLFEGEHVGYISVNLENYLILDNGIPKESLPLVEAATDFVLQESIIEAKRK